MQLIWTVLSTIRQICAILTKKIQHWSPKMKKIVFISQTKLYPNLAEKTMEAMSEQGYVCTAKTVHQLKNSDYDNYDILVGIEQADLRDMYHICGGDFAGKMYLLTAFIDRLTIRIWI